MNIRTLAASITAAACACAKAETTPGPALLIDLAGNTAKADLPGGTYGEPIPNLSDVDRSLFANGSAAFVHSETSATGLGPVFNGISCSSCHDAPPATGGTNQRVERRYGRRNPDGSFNPLTSLGGSLLHDQGIGAVSGHTFNGELVPAEANVVAGRRTQPLFGLGLVDATADATFEAIARYQAATAPQAAGRVASVVDLATGQKAAGRFGWKGQIATLFQFSGDAALNELGLTNPQFPDEVCPGGDCGALAFDPVPGLNDPGGQRVQRFADFMLLLGPPPAPAADTAQGAAVFEAIGCAVCHLPMLVTAPNPRPALDQVAYHPYSDFLLHDMGSLGDGIAQADASPNEMRTAPLWGLSVQTQLLHDARANSVSEAIDAHDGQGAAAKLAFDALAVADRAALLQFLQTL